MRYLIPEESRQACSPQLYFQCFGSCANQKTRPGSEEISSRCSQRQLRALLSFPYLIPARRPWLNRQATCRRLSRIWFVGLTSALLSSPKTQRLGCTRKSCSPLTLSWAEEATKTAPM